MICQSVKSYTKLKNAVKPECWQESKPIRCRVSHAQADKTGKAIPPWIVICVEKLDQVPNGSKHLIPHFQLFLTVHIFSFQDIYPLNFHLGLLAHLWSNYLRLSNARDSNFYSNILVLTGVAWLLSFYW